jgi:hypothetical protein
MEKQPWKPGETIWLNCEISPGPLNENLVRVQLGNERWFGFVKKSELSNDKKQVRAIVLEVKRGLVTIGIPGHSPTSNNAITTRSETIKTEHGAFA